MRRAASTCATSLLTGYEPARLPRARRRSVIVPEHPSRAADLPGLDRGGGLEPALPRRHESHHQ
eukprot:scaffold40_cov413-Prasinococcus_capsulatus_cf.AAC.5